ncbi:MAG: hypothetical protein EZS28_021266 [Streblomastix strix]|uniref:Uncharacterized protein n=1 Tax=Streblomastix strix TaxID=222440 RepID=A0A5J4VKT2_9EUKA|nr:MAG: hypothetical protein EZS28_021266 [Streblomastix strix]
MQEEQITYVVNLASCHRVITIMPQKTAENGEIQTQFQFKEGAKLLNFLPQWRSTGQNIRVIRDIATIWRYQTSSGLFRQVLKPNIRDLNEERGLDQDFRLLTIEQRDANRKLQIGRNHGYSEENSTRRLDYIYRFILSLPVLQNSGRAALLPNY